jgi:hypothetical protein
MAKDANAGSRFQISLRALMVLCIVLGLLFAYVGSCYRLSRRGMREAEEIKLEGFFYIPIADAAAGHDRRHYWLMVFFAPANWVDQRVFGAPGPASSVMWGLSPWHPSEFVERYVATLPQR